MLAPGAEARQGQRPRAPNTSREHRWLVLGARVEQALVCHREVFTRDVETLNTKEPQKGSTREHPRFSWKRCVRIGGSKRRHG